MDKETIKGEAEKLGGKLKEGAGKVTGNEKLKSEGKAEQAEGEGRRVVGNVKDAARDAADQVKDRTKP